MAGRASPSPLRLLMVLLTLTASPHLSLSQDADVLLKFKAALAANGRDTVLGNWVANSTLCKKTVSLWTGVLCDRRGNVYGLKMENMNLSGKLSIDVLVDLHGLRTLSFMNNDLEAPIPDITKLPALKNIYLSNNKFSGEIADGMFENLRPEGGRGGGGCRRRGGWVGCQFFFLILKLEL